MADDQNVYYVRCGWFKTETCGPVTRRELARLLLDGRITPTTAVFIDGQWTTCRNIASFPEYDELGLERR